MKYIKKHMKRMGVLLCLAICLIGLLPSDVSAAAKNFNKKKTITISGSEDYVHTQKYTWIKYKAPNNGYITVTAQNKEEKLKDGASGDNTGQAYATGEWRLFYSKNKTPLSGGFVYNTAGNTSADYTMVYGVRKNTTYYLQVQAQGAVSVKCKFIKVSKSSADKKAKASLLAKGKLAKGILSAGDSTADWYKINVPKKQYLHFYYSGKANGQIQLTFSGAYLNTAKRYVVQGSEEEGYAYTIERVQPGNYYVKVERADSLSSGFYTLKWQ